MTDINKLWHVNIKGKCIHECNAGGICIYCGELGTPIPAYDEDPAVFKRCVVEYELDIDPPNCFSGNRNTGEKQWVVRAMSPNHNAITVINPNLQHAVMLTVLKIKGVDVDD